MKNIFRNLKFFLASLVICLSLDLNAQDITGDWYGVWQEPDSFHVSLHIYKNHNGLYATMDRPMTATFSDPLDEITFKNDTLYYRLSGLDHNFKGYPNHDYSKINGEMTSHGRKYPLNFGRNKLKRIMPVNEELLKVITAKVRVLKAGNFKKNHYTGVRVVKAGIPKVIKINTSELKVFTPGKNTMSIPTKYEFPVSIRKDECPIRFEDSLVTYIVKVKQTESISAQPMRMKDVACFSIQYLDLEQGLRDPLIWSMLEDSRGNMWFVSQFGGICRYDGLSLTYYTPQEGLTSTGNRAIIEDRNGNIWIGTDFGLCKYDGKSFITYPGFVLPQIFSMLESRNGNIWIGALRGVFEKIGDSYFQYTENEGLINNVVRSIIEDQLGNLWFGTDGGVCKYNGVSFTHFTVNEGLNSNNVTSIVEDKFGNLWFGTDRGLCKYDGKSFQQFTINEGLSSNNVYSLMVDKNGSLWIGTWGGGVNIFDGNAFTQITAREGLNNENVISVMEDKAGNIWLATYGGGVMKFQTNSFTYFMQLENIFIGHSQINSIIEDRDSNIWFGTGTRGIIKYDGEFFITMSDNEDPRTKFVHCMVNDNKGNIWYNYFNEGIQKFDGNSITVYSEEFPLVCNVISIFEDKKGNIWLGTSGEGLKKFDGNSFTLFLGNFNPNYKYEYVQSILQDQDGNIWYGSNPYGLFKYDGKCITHYNPNENLSDKCVTSIFEDMTGNIWIGTQNGGINKFDGKLFIKFTEKEGLCNNHVTSIIGDKKGNIWVGTIKGISKLSSQENGNWLITSFSTADGLKDLSFNQNSVCLDSRNRLWWGTSDIITMLDLNMPELIPKPPLIQLNNIYLNQKFIDFRALLPETEEEEYSTSEIDGRMKIRGLKFSDVAPFYNYPVDLVLPHYLNHVTFNFSAIDWTFPQSIRYQYMLEGMDEQWSTLSTENQADYRNIPSGSYNFKVKAVSKANLWSDIFEYPFIVSPPLWFRWWAFTIYALAFILLAFYYIRYIISRERIKAEVQIKQIEVDKMQEMDQMKSRFFANISHEFRTPLTLLTGPINDLMRKKDRLEEGDRKLLSIMKRNAARLQQLINQLLDLSKLETGNLKLRISEGNLTAFIKTIILSFLSLAESKKINYKYDLQEMSGPCFYDEDKVQKILTNLVANALKFTPEGGSVMVTLRYHEEKGLIPGQLAEIKVKDSGPGIPENEKEKIFGRFYQVSSSDSRKYEGSGIGLALARELVQLYRGEIYVDSEVGKGSTFTVVLPVSREHFREEEFIPVSEKQPETILIDDHEILTKETAESEIRIHTVKEKEKDKPVILIVEDNADLRKYISQNLLSYYQILEAENGKEGMDKSIEHIPDLVISDLMMPEMDGVEMCSRLKKDARTSHIPIVMLTAKADRETKLESLETGADDYIIKPFDAEELQVRIKNLIEQRRNLR